MNQADLQQLKASTPKTWHMLRAMGGVGTLCSLMIVFTYQITLPTIERNKAEALERAVFQVLPGTQTKITFKLNENNQFEPFSGDTKGMRVVYAGYDENKELIGIALEASGQGFQDIIRIIYGYSATENAVIGFQVLESKETPGLGDKIEKDQAFLDNFKALDVTMAENQTEVLHPIVPVKKGEKNNPWEIESITGATISSKAIANIMRNSTGELIPLLVNSLDNFRNAAKKAAAE